MFRVILKLAILFIILIGLPLTGVVLSGDNILVYLEFPPITRYVEHAPFSLPIFFGLGGFIIALVVPFVFRTWSFIGKNSISKKKMACLFRWWGYMGLIAGLVAWVLAWTRFDWFTCFQTHTFVPLWLSYILVINALTKRRSGRCLMTRNTGAFLCLFPVSAAFWWLFEYLNRFTQNWYYVEVSRFSPLEYFLLASASFSTVLPAVLSTRDYFLTFPFFEEAFGRYDKVNPYATRVFVWVSIIVTGAGLACIRPFQNFLFPLLWISPLFIIVLQQVLTDKRHIFSDLAEGRWTMIVASAISALACGFFWEMWNYFSLAKWTYSIPFVGRFHIFEMPLLGYAGYLPFGLECAAIGGLILSDERED